MSAKLWRMLNGKKTYIGAALLFASAVLEQVVQGIWEVDADWVGKTIFTLNWFGMAFTGTGMVHKYLKDKIPDIQPKEGEKQ